jgi:hypothetical protein
MSDLSPLLGGKAEVGLRAVGSAVGTNRTNPAGLLMSVPRGRPEVIGRLSKRR